MIDVTKSLDVGIGHSGRTVMISIQCADTIDAAMLYGEMMERARHGVLKLDLFINADRRLDA